jgi:hypothetical protein
VTDDRVELTEIGPPGSRDAYAAETRAELDKLLGWNRWALPMVSLTVPRSLIERTRPWSLELPTPRRLSCCSWRVAPVPTAFAQR